MLCLDTTASWRRFRDPGAADGWDLHEYLCKASAVQVRVRVRVPMRGQCEYECEYKCGCGHEYRLDGIHRLRRGRSTGTSPSV